MRSKYRGNSTERDEYHAYNGNYAHAPAVVEVDLAVVDGVDVECLSQKYSSAFLSSGSVVSSERRWTGGEEGAY